MSIKSDSAINPIKIRKAAQPADWLAIRELCCLTGNSGAPIERERFDFFGELWVGPYQYCLPDWAYVATRDDKVVGYLTGCPNTPLFELVKITRFHPRVLAQLARGKFERNADVRRYLRRLTPFERSPVESFSRDTRFLIDERYPAHLHVNLAADARGGGAGRRLVDAFTADLSREGIAGVHIHCGEKPVPFYEALGFKHLDSIRYGSVPVHAMGLELT